MRARLVVIFAATTVFAGSAIAAEPASPPARPAEQPQAQHPDIVLASADPLASPSTGPQAQPAPRHARVARVTTCRCGDQQSSPDE